MTLKADTTDFARSHCYLDIREALRAQRAEDALNAYERNRERLESFNTETTLVEILHRCPIMFLQSGTKWHGWANMAAGASKR